MAGTEGPELAPEPAPEPAPGPAPARRRARPRAAHRIIDDLGAIARDKAHVLRGEIDDLVDARKQTAADGLADLSQALRQASHLLSNRGRAALATLGQTGADRLDGAATAIREHDLGTLIGDAQGLVRRDPLLLAAGATALGFLAIRMLLSTVE
jgi:hypothetical protein